MPHGHGHHHHHHGDLEGRKLLYAVVINVLLTVVQIIAGLFSGSIALIADALHNLGDAGALVIAHVARRIANVPASSTMTYGYRRAEIIAAAINGTALLITAIYLVYEAVKRIFDPVEINGWVVVVVATVALAVDALTVLLTHKGAKESLNIRAAYIHNLTDALASLAVIISGLLIIAFDWHFVDVVLTVLIAAYVFYHSLLIMKESILILMQAAPRHLDTDIVTSEIVKIEGILDVPHLHIWQLNDREVVLEAQIMSEAADLKTLMGLRGTVREVLKNTFNVTHATLELFAKDDTPSIVD